MIHRLCKLSKNNSFFLFGPRGVGKSTLLKHWFKGQSVFHLDLLDPQLESIYSSNPQRLLEDWKAKKTAWIVIDEIQKIPALLDVAHQGIENDQIKFAMTGSSARKLRRGASNLLGGRAFEFHLHSMTSLELGNQFDLLSALRWGTLPAYLNFDEDDKVRALYSYVTTYLKEEVLIEQLIRKIEPFRKFLEVAAQSNGKILNYSKIARDAGVEEKSVARYYQILEDTLLGFFLEPFDYSIRKRQMQKSKFYFFDTGVTRTLQNRVTLELNPQSISYGDLFEQFVILEFIRLNDAFESHFKFSYFMSKDNLEIDLIIERPGQPIALIEIKSKDYIYPEDANSLRKVESSFAEKEMYVLSNSKSETVIENVNFFHWKKGLLEIFGKTTDEL